MVTGLSLAVCADAGVTRLDSEDMQHGADIDGVKIVNPFKAWRQIPNPAPNRSRLAKSTAFTTVIYAEADRGQVLAVVAKTFSFLATRTGVDLRYSIDKIAVWIWHNQ